MDRVMLGMRFDVFLDLGIVHLVKGNTFSWKNQFVSEVGNTPNSEYRPISQALDAPVP